MGADEAGNSVEIGVDGFGQAIVDAVKASGFDSHEVALEVELPLPVIMMHRHLMQHVLGMGAVALPSETDLKQATKDLWHGTAAGILQRAGMFVRQRAHHEGTGDCWGGQVCLRLAFDHPRSHLPVLEAMDAGLAAHHAANKRARGRQPSKLQRPARSHQHFEKVVPFKFSKHLAALVASDKGTPAYVVSPLLRSREPPAFFPFRLRIEVRRNPFYIGGRYLKLVRNLPQSEWWSPENGEAVAVPTLAGGVPVVEKLFEASVEQYAAEWIVKQCGADSFKFHAAGREDEDVRMLGNGRPFALELEGVKRLPSAALLAELPARVRAASGGDVVVMHTRRVQRAYLTALSAGSDSKQKRYCAMVQLAKPRTAEQLRAALDDAGVIVLQQRTPVRVLHRRAIMMRQRHVWQMKSQQLTPHCFLLHCETSAGTYVKEFVHGDLGRTTPSVGELLGCDADILQLDVTGHVDDATGGGEAAALAGGEELAGSGVLGPGGLAPPLGVVIAPNDDNGDGDQEEEG